MTAVQTSSISHTILFAGVLPDKRSLCGPVRSVIHNRDIPHLSVSTRNVPSPSALSKLEVFESQPTTTAQRAARRRLFLLLSFVSLASSSPLSPFLCHSPSDPTASPLAQFIAHAGNGQGTTGPAPSEMNDIIYCACRQSNQPPRHQRGASGMISVERVTSFRSQFPRGGA